MFNGFIITSLLLQSGLVLGFADIAQRLAEKRQAIGQIVPFPEIPGAPAHSLYNKFDAAAQLTSTTGDHAWMAPGPGDIRGPCPGLNAAANHNYLPRNGIATFETVNTGLLAAFGLEETATNFLQQTTSFFDGDPLSQKWSIGYHSDQTAFLGPVQESLLGIQSGICAYGHLKSEGDASITRGDFLAPTNNSNCASYPHLFQQLLDLADLRNPDTGFITPPVLAEHQHNRKLNSIATNPNYFAPPFAGIAFTPAAHLFVFEMMANHSSDYPRGFLTQDVLMDFFSYSRDVNGQLVYKYGYERIPDNWYRRANDDVWTLADIVLGVASQCAAFPSTCQIGGNTGTVNSFTGVDLNNISGGLVNSAAFFQDPSKLGCFISQAIQAEAPTSLAKVFSGASLASALALIPTKLLPALAPLGTCANLPAGKTIDEYGNGFPGAVVQYSGPRANSA